MRDCGARTGTGISGILRDWIHSRAASAGEREKARLTTEGRNAFAPVFPHEMRHKNNPMRRNAAWAASAKEHALEKRNCLAGTARRETSDASGGCAFQARRMRGLFPKRALRRAHGVTFVSPRRGGIAQRRVSTLRNRTKTKRAVSARLRGANRNRDFGDFKGLDSLPRRVCRRTGKSPPYDRRQECLRPRVPA